MVGPRSERSSVLSHQPVYTKVPRAGKVVQPFLQALNVNSHATINIFEALVASIDLLEGKIKEATEQLGSRVDDIELSLKNLTHNVQGYAEPVRDPAMPATRRQGRSNQLFNDDEAYSRAADRLQELEDESQFLDIGSRAGTPAFGATPNSPARPIGGTNASHAHYSSIGDERLHPPTGVMRVKAPVPPEPAGPEVDEEEGEGGAGGEGGKKRPSALHADHGAPPALHNKSPRHRWKWALGEVRKRYEANRASLLHSRTPARLNIRDRLVKNEDKLDQLLYEMDQFKQAFTELVLNDKKSEQIHKLQGEVSGLQHGMVAVESGMDNQQRQIDDLKGYCMDQIEAESQSLRSLMDEKQAEVDQHLKDQDALVAMTEQELADFKKYTTATLEMHDQEGEKLEDSFRGMCQALLRSLLTEVEERMEDAIHNRDQGMASSLMILKDNLNQAIRVAGNKHAIKEGHVLNMVECLLRNIEEVMSKGKGKFTKGDPVLLERLTEAELQLRTLSHAQQSNSSKLSQIVQDFREKIQGLENNAETIKFNMSHKVDNERHVTDLSRKIDADQLLKVRQELLAKMQEEQHISYVKISEELDRRMSSSPGGFISAAPLPVIHQQQGPDQRTLDQIAQLAKSVNRAIENYEELQLQLGSKAAEQEVTGALAAINDKLMHLSLESLPREQIQEWLQSKADKKELQDLAVRLTVKSGAEYEDSMSFIVARKKLQPMLKCLSCNHPLPLKNVKNLEDNGNPPWQALLGIDHFHNKRRTQDDILVGAKSDLLFERDPLLLEDGQLLSRYPRMMPPPNRVRTAVGGGALGLGVRAQIKEKLEKKKELEKSRNEYDSSPLRPHLNKIKVTTAAIA